MYFRLFFVSALMLFSALSQAEDGKAIVLPTNKPDLQVTDFALKGTVSSQSYVTLSWAVRNASTKSISTDWTDSIVLSNSKTSIAQSVEVTTAASPASLRAQGGYTRSKKVMMPRLTSGTYYLWVVADSGTDVSESSELNNTKIYGPIKIGTGGVAVHALPEIERLFVSSGTGNDTSGLGTDIEPLRTIQTALTHAATYASATQPVKVYVGDGVYDDVFTMPQHVQLVGANPFDPSETIIRPSFDKLKGTNGVGVLISSEDSTIRNLTIQADSQVKGLANLRLVVVQNAAVKVDNVVFDGGGVAGLVGLTAQLSLSSNTTITRSRFENMEVGIQTSDCAPNITRNTFENISGDAIVVNAPTTKALGVVPMLGSTSPDTGFNIFRNISGLYIRNNTSTLVMAEFNDWDGILDLDVLDDFFNGPNDHNPATPYSLFLSSLLVTVVDDATDDPIYNAEVSLEPSAQPPLTENVDGIYTFPLVPEADYTVVVEAAGYYGEEVDVSVGPPNIVTNVVVHLEPDDTGEKSTPDVHNSDKDGDGKIELNELLRATQFFNSAGVRCLVSSEDGYAPGVGDTSSCDPHTGDYEPVNWRISLSELLRLIQLYSLNAYHQCEGTEDGYCTGAK